MQSLSSSQLHFEEGGRLIVVGDIHGMKKPLEYVLVLIRCKYEARLTSRLPFASHLLKKLRFQPDKDKLIHTGDTIIRGPHSLEVLEFLTANNVSGWLSFPRFPTISMLKNRVIPRRSWEQ